jgi:hypothetical protein
MLVKLKFELRVPAKKSNRLDQDFCSGRRLSSRWHFARLFVLVLTRLANMDAKLLKEFEEMEGLSKETLIDPEMVVNEDSDDDDGGSFKPVAANSLSSSDIYNEV